MWTVVSYASGHEYESEPMTFGEAVDLRDSMRDDGDMTAVIIAY